jgi:putative copper export protein
MSLDPSALLAAAPLTPLSPVEDSVVAWLAWTTLMGAAGVAALALFVVRPAARRAQLATTSDATARLARLALLLGVLAVPATLARLAKGLAEDGGYDLSGAVGLLYDGTNAGRLAGLGVTFTVLALLLVLPLARRARVGEPGTRWLLLASTLSGAAALATTKFPDEAPEEVGRTVFQTAMWFGHLIGGAVWLGGLLGLLAVALPGVVPAAGRGAFWSTAIRRFSVAAMSSVGAVVLSGLWLYWNHVDTPSQLLSTTYGRVLGTKLALFGALFLLGGLNQFWLHPRIEALRAAGEERSLAVLLLRRFPAVVAVEVVLIAAVLLVAPFLHGSARNQAFQAQALADGAPADDLPKLAPKEITTSTWVLGGVESVVVVLVLSGGYLASGRLVRRRRIAGEQEQVPGLVDA